MLVMNKTLEKSLGVGALGIVVAALVIVTVYTSLASHRWIHNRLHADDPPRVSINYEFAPGAHIMNSEIGFPPNIRIDTNGFWWVVHVEKP